jgi:hypothetical protein
VAPQHRDDADEDEGALDDPRRYVTDRQFLELPSHVGTITTAVPMFAMISSSSKSAPR